MISSGLPSGLVRSWRNTMHAMRLKRKWSSSNLLLLLWFSLAVLVVIGIALAFKTPQDVSPSPPGSTSTKGVGESISPAPPKAPTFNWVATLSLQPGSFFVNGKGKCWGYEVAPNEEISLVDAENDPIVTTTLIPGEVKDGTCRMPFSFTGIPSGFLKYKLTTPIGSREFTETEMHAIGLVPLP
jgi:hypothetical protein